MYILIAISIIILDQITKWLVVTNLGYGYEVQIVKNFFYVTYVRNKGAAWGIFQNGRIFFVLMTILVVIGILYLMSREKSSYKKVVFSFILGGALGNFIDRLFRGYVIDFLDFYIFSYNFPTFNVADIFITVGTILIIYEILVKKSFWEESSERKGVKNEQI